MPKTIDSHCHICTYITNCGPSSSCEKHKKEQFCAKYRTKEEANDCSGYMYTSTKCTGCRHNLSE